MRAYVSSSFKDLEEVRTYVLNAFHKLQYVTLGMEYYPASTKPPLEKCLEDVNSCDLYIGIFAMRYGSIPPGYELSFTELELREAEKNHIPCLIFLKDESTITYPEIEWEARNKILELRQYLLASNKHIVEKFRSNDDLEAKLVEAVYNWEKESGLRRKVDLTDWDAYRKALYEAYCNVPLAAITDPKYDKDSLNRIPLLEVFVPQLAAAGKKEAGLTEALPEETPNTITSLQEKTDKPTEPDPKTIESSNETLAAFEEEVLEILAREPIQVFLGGPGSGKSTLLHYALLSICNQTGSENLLPHLQSSPLPFLIELRSYVLDSEKSDFLAFILKNSKEKLGVSIDSETLKDIFHKKGGALVFFDGLDEVFDNYQYAQVLDQFRAFHRQYPETILVVTSRIAGYDPGRIDLEDIRHYTLLDFTLSQIQQFIPKWYKFFSLEGTERTPFGLIERISESARLRELAGNPLLLTMMAIIYKHRDLPEDRWKLYEVCTSALLEIWEIKGHFIHPEEYRLNIPIHEKQKASMLQRVSIYMLEHYKGKSNLNAIDEDQLLKILAGYFQEEYNKSRGEANAIVQDILKHLHERTYILAEIAPGQYGFVHRTFMEYFAACNYEEIFSEKGADYAWLSEKVYGKNWEKSEWQEPLLLLIAKLKARHFRIMQLVEYLHNEFTPAIPNNVAFAARCLAEAGKDGVREDPMEAKKLLTSLAQGILKYVTWTKDSSALKFMDSALAAFLMLAPLTNSTAEIRKVIRKLNSSKVLVQKVIAWQMDFALKSREDRREFALEALKNSEEVVRRGAIAALERDWPGSVEVGGKLVEVVRNDTHGRVRQAALQSLQRAWPGDTRVLEAIDSRAEEESAYTNVNSIIAYLKNNWRGNPYALKLILKLAGKKINPNDSYSYSAVRQAAVEAILTGWRERPDTFNNLKELAAHHPDVYSRFAAGTALILGWPEQAESEELARHWIIEAQDADTKIEMIRFIASTWRSNPGMLEFIISQDIPKEGNISILTAWVDAITGGWGDNPVSFETMKLWCTQTDNPDLSSIAIDRLAKYWTGIPEVPDLLHEWSLRGENAVIRRAAILAIGKSEKLYRVHDKEIKNWAIHAEYPDVRSAAIEAISTNRRISKFDNDPFSSVIPIWFNEEIIDLSTPGLLKFLLERANNDLSPMVRFTALKYIFIGIVTERNTIFPDGYRSEFEYFIIRRNRNIISQFDKSDLWEPLKNLFTQDPDPQVRQLASLILTQIQGDDSQKKIWLEKQMGTAFYREMASSGHFWSNFDSIQYQEGEQT